MSDIDRHTCTLHWKPPAYDGGVKITHYQVERKDITHVHWVIVSSFCKDTTCLVQGLTEGQEYLFRVMAVNENGMSQPLEGVNPIKAKPPFGRSFIFLTIYFQTNVSTEEIADRRIRPQIRRPLRGSPS